MTHTLWRAAELLGEGDLAPMPAADGVLSGPFRPTVAFAAAWPAFDRLRATQASLAAAVGMLPRGARADVMRARLTESGAGDAIAAALAAVEALGLEVRDAGGRAIVGVQAFVSAWAVPVPGDLTPAQRAAAERDAAEAGVMLGGPNYILVVTPKPDRAGAQAGGSTGAL